MMRDLSCVLFAAAAIMATLGMAWGIQMGIAHDFTMMPAHAHLNLAGWVTLALYAIYYRLTPTAAQGLLPRVQALLAIVGVAIFVPGIAISVSSGSPGVAIFGSLLVFAAMVLFLCQVMRHGLGGAGAR